MSETNAERTLFLFSVGPVQSYIAAARKTRDLWAGSFLLARLIHLGMEKARGIRGAEIISPGNANNVDVASLPNRFLFRLNGGRSADELKAIGKTLEDAVCAEFDGLVRHAVGLLSHRAGPSAQIEDFVDRQLQGFLETYWVAVTGDCEHAELYERAERALAGRKNLKTFPLAGAEHGLKCSLCGEREAVRRKSDRSIADVQSFWSILARKDRRFNGAEYLCAVCLGKRLAPEYWKKDHVIYDSRFPSTAEIAFSPYRRLLVTHLPNEYAKFTVQAGAVLGLDGCLLPAVRAQTGGEQVLDGHWYFPDNLRPRGAARQRPGIAESEIGKIRVECERLHRALKDCVPDLRLSGYYAVIFMDADRLGHKLRSVGEEQEHRCLSTKLAEFAAGDVKRIVEKENAGRLVYAGGDDIVAFVTISDLLSVIEQLRNAFAFRFNAGFPSLGPFSLSGGICISHYKNPLSVTLETGRQMVELAKDANGAGRNGFAITVLSHSGNNKQSFGRWEYSQGDSFVAVVPLLEKLRGLLSAGAVSDRFVYHMKRQFAGLVDLEGRMVLGLPAYGELVESELLRLLKRAVDEVRLKAYLAETATTTPISNYLLDFGGRLGEVFVQMDNNLRNFTALLEITAIVAREGIG